MDINAVLQLVAQALPGFLLAIVAHEWAHGRMALAFGDDTAKRAGRLSFNPVVHFDLWGSLIVPAICISLGGAVFGWAKPVPIDTRNLKFKEVRKAIFWISFAGPLTNFILGTLSAIIFAIIYTQVPPSFSFYMVALKMLQYSIFINFLLGVFNLIPLPPLDGSKMVAVFLRGEALMKFESIGRYTNMIFLAIIGLSLMGIQTLGYLFMPVFAVVDGMTNLFVFLFSLI